MGNPNPERGGRGASVKPFDVEESRLFSMKLHFGARTLASSTILSNRGDKNSIRPLEGELEWEPRKMLRLGNRRNLWRKPRWVYAPFAPQPSSLYRGEEYGDRAAPRDPSRRGRAK
jgi:hypothetical protein